MLLPQHPAFTTTTMPYNQQTTFVNKGVYETLTRLLVINCVDVDLTSWVVQHSLHTESKKRRRPVFASIFQLHAVMQLISIMVQPIHPCCHFPNGAANLQWTAKIQPLSVSGSPEGNNSGRAIRSCDFFLHFCFHGFWQFWHLNAFEAFVFLCFS